MSQTLSLLWDVHAHEGKLAHLKQVATNLVQDVKKNESGTLVYNCVADDKNNRLCFADTYASSEAFLAHATRPMVGEALNDIMANGTTKNLIVWGDVSPAAREALGGMGATFMQPVAGFDRTAITHTV